MAVSESQLKASSKYKKAVKRIELCFLRDELLEDLMDAVQENNTNTATLIKQLIKTYLEERTGKTY